MEEGVHIFGIRHHGPGSAGSLRRALERLRPDLVLIEGPPEADRLIPLAGEADMLPPVALLVYAPDEPRRAAFYPFACFSPEWQAMRYSLGAGIPARFMDLPAAHQLAAEVCPLSPPPDADAPAEEATPQAVHAGDAGEPGGTGGTGAAPLPSDPVQPASPAAQAAAPDLPPTTADGEPVPTPDGEPVSTADEPFRFDPLDHLARAAGYSDGERWWDHMVETRRGDDDQVFDAVREAMVALRESQPAGEPLEQQREAFMRKTLREAKKDGFQRIAVVCGAWHVPALLDLLPAREDQALLKGLDKIKTQAAWVPWSYDRLAFASGYGAGVDSPEWYHLLWETGGAAGHGLDSTSNVQRATSNIQRPGSASASSLDVGRSTLDVERFPAPSPISTWLTRVARMLRGADMDASSAQVIEAVRLAETLAALRGRALPGLAELDEAALTVICAGQAAPMGVIRRKLVIGERMGRVPANAPTVPLQQDLARLQKRLRLPASAVEKDYDLDLRKPLDLERSRLLHRLNLLDLPWGRRQEAPRGSTGTFHEYWRLRWEVEFPLRLIEAARLGNTVAEAAGAAVAEAAGRADNLAALTGLLDDAMLADLPDAVAVLTNAIQRQAAVAADVVQLMAALPPLARVMRYGNVRQTDASMVAGVLDGLVARIAVGLGGACAALDDEAAEAMHQRIVAVHESLALLQNQEHLAVWLGAVGQLLDRQTVHGLVAGRACRLLHETGKLEPAEAARRLSLALSMASEPPQAAAWAEGFLRGSGLLLIHDAQLWGVIDAWVTGLTADHFTEILPLLRRTFASFAFGERRQMGQMVAQGPRTSAGAPASAGGEPDVDLARARLVLPLLTVILGGEP